MNKAAVEMTWVSVSWKKQT